MDNFTWKANPDFKNPVIDDAHNLLLAILNQFQELHLKKNHPEANKKLDEFIEETQKHFFLEETLMRENDFPEIDLHTKEHEILFEAMQDIRKVYHMEPEAEVGTRTAKFLFYWMQEHLETMDLSFAKFLKF